MPGVAVVNSGNYDLQIATGFQVDAFVLDDALKGVLDNTEYVLDGTTEFADVMDSVTNVMVRRGPGWDRSNPMVRLQQRGWLQVTCLWK